MKITADYIVVGAGVTGATIARTLADAGREIVVIDRRCHLGGNVYDRIEVNTGLRYHVYGPHYFRTNSDKLWEWVQRFSEFYKFEAKVKTCINNCYYRWPLTNANLKLWDIAVKGYNQKMWGTESPPQEIRLRIDQARANDGDPRLKLDKYQGLPTVGYGSWVGYMLGGITCYLNVDYLKRQEEIEARKLLVFTGPIDEFYGFNRGRLQYRAQQRRLVVTSGTEPISNVVQVNFPESTYGHIRRIEWNHLQQVPSWRGGTLVTYETPYTPKEPNQYEYPFNNEANKALYKIYRVRADATPKLLLCGRLGEYRYYDIDQAIARALVLAERILDEQK